MDDDSNERDGTHPFQRKEFVDFSNQPEWLTEDHYRAARFATAVQVSLAVVEVVKLTDDGVESNGDEDIVTLALQTTLPGGEDHRVDVYAFEPANAANTAWLMLKGLDSNTLRTIVQAILGLLAHRMTEGLPGVLGGKKVPPSLEVLEQERRARERRNGGGA